MIDLRVVEASPADAESVNEVIHAAFGARPPLDPPGSAMHETPATVAAAIGGTAAGGPVAGGSAAEGPAVAGPDVDGGGGLIARVDGEPAGAMLLTRSGEWLGLRRVSVHPRFQHRGVATAMVGCAEEVAGDRGLSGVRLVARVELPETVTFWRHRGYVEVERHDRELTLAKRLPVELTVGSAEEMTDLGVRLAWLLRAGDLVLLAGELGAGKTTLTQGLGAGLGVRGPITSPTFVLARSHPALSGAGPALVHVDAYRLGGVAELDDLDLDTSADDAVTVVEWGEGLAEGLAQDRLEISLSRPRGAGSADTSSANTGWEGALADDEPRTVRVVPVGRRWTESAGLRALTPS